MTQVGHTMQGRGVYIGAHSKEAMPATAASAGYIVIFDGTLYNRSTLRDHFARFRGQPENDAELALWAYREWGEEMLHQIKGIFALIIWSGDRDTLLCMRDPFGAYPLFFTETTGALWLSISIEALLQQPRVSGDVNRAALAESLCHRWPKPEETFFQAIKRVPPGHVMRMQNGGRQLYQYWDPAPEGTPVDSMTEEELEQFDELLEQAVERCLVPDRAGIFLSGGLDSVSVGVVAADVAKREGWLPAWALSLAFPHPSCNEEAVQRSAADGLGLPHVVVPFTEAAGSQGLLRSNLEISETWPAPLQNPWLAAYYHLGGEGQRRGCRVILTGIGGDDWLTVNTDYMADLIRGLNARESYRFVRNILQSYALPRLAMLRFLVWRSGILPLLALQGRRLVRSVAPDRLNALRRWRLTRLQSTPKWVAPDPELRQHLNQRTEERVERTLRRAEPEGPYGFYNYNVMSQTFAQPMAAMEQEEYFEIGRRLGLRIAHPYWDPDLVAFLCQIPPRLLLRGGREKGLVRETVAQRLPAVGFAQHKKVSASDYFKSILLAEGPNVWAKTGGTTALIDLGVIDAAEIDAIMASSLSSSQLREVHRVWEVLNLETWVRSRLRVSHKEDL
jgi:asparagine synthase (glutamine-hydrolysing)